MNKKTPDQRLRRPFVTYGYGIIRRGGLPVVLWGSAPDFW